MNTIDPPPNMALIVNTLRDLYTDDGVAIWLGSRHRMLNNERPIELCMTQPGRDRVWQILDALASGAGSDD